MTSGDNTDSPEDYSVYIDKHFQSKLLALEDGFCTTAGYNVQKTSPIISKPVVKNKQSKQTFKQHNDDVGILSGWWYETPTHPRKRPGREKEPRDSPKEYNSWRDGNNSYRTRQENFVFKHYTDIRKYIEQYRKESILSHERPFSGGKGHHYTGTHNDAKRNFTKKDDQKVRDEKPTTVLHYTHKRDSEICNRHMADPSIQTHVYKLSNNAKGSGDYEVKTKSPNSSTGNQDSKLNGTISVAPSTLPTFNNTPSLTIHRTKNDEVPVANSNVRTIDGLTSLATPDKGQLLSRYDDIELQTGVRIKHRPRSEQPFIEEDEEYYKEERSNTTRERRLRTNSESDVRGLPKDFIIQCKAETSRLVNDIHLAQVRKNNLKIDVKGSNYVSSKRNGYCSHTYGNSNMSGIQKGHYPIGELGKALKPLSLRSRNKGKSISKEDVCESAKTKRILDSLHLNATEIGSKTETLESPEDATMTLSSQSANVQSALYFKFWGGSSSSTVYNLDNERMSLRDLRLQHIGEILRRRDIEAKLSKELKQRQVVNDII